MSLLETAFVAARDRKRLADIIRVLANFGLADVLNRLGLTGLLAAEPDNANPVQQQPAPVRLRLAIEALGATFIKLGQILSTRRDLLAPEWISELEKLQSHVPALPWDTMKAQIETDLGRSIANTFLHVETTPLAAGSIAQVYRARLLAGDEVVVKVRRPELASLIEADLRLLSHIAALAEQQWAPLARYRIQDVLHHLGAAMAEELDFLVEARNSEAIAAQLHEHPYIKIPTVYAELSSERLMVQEYIDGIAPTNSAAIAAAGLQGKLLAERGAQGFLHSMLLGGIFHADPHPGNLRALPGNRIAFIDFGMVGRLGTRRREQLLLFVDAIVGAKGTRLCSILLEWSGVPEDFSWGRLEADCDAFCARYSQPPLRLSQAILDLMALARRHQLVLPADLALLFKALITADGVMRSLDPQFDAVAIATPMVTEGMLQGYSPSVLQQKIQSFVLQLLSLGNELPSVLHLLIQRIRQGKVEAKIEITGLDKLASTINRAAARMAIAIVTAAFAMGLAPGLLNVGPNILGIPVTLMLGLAVIVVGLFFIFRR